MAINMDAKIKFVRGNVFTREFELKNVDLNLVFALRIVCEDLKIIKSIYPNDEGIFTFHLSTVETGNMPDIHTTYNLDVVFIDGSKKTIFYKEQFIVLPNDDGSAIG